MASSTTASIFGVMEQEILNRYHGLVFMKHPPFYLIGRLEEVVIALFQPKRNPWKTWFNKASFSVQKFTVLDIFL
jgi:hypothetical protein